MLAQLTDRWTRATRREQYILVALAAVALLALLWRLNDAAGSVRLRLLALSEQAAASGDGVDEALWTGRASDAAAAAAAWRAATWQGASNGVLSAEIQARLMEIGAASGVTSMVIEVDPAPLSVGAVSMLRFRLSGAALYRTSTPEFLAAVAANEKRLILDETTIDITTEGGAGRVSASGLAPILVDPAPAADGAPS